MKIREKIKMVVMGLATVATLGTAVAIAPTVGAESEYSGITQYTSGTSVAGGDDDLMTRLQVIINVALGVIGFVAVGVIILGGVQYTTSTGDAAKVAKAKNTILYGIIGLIIALLAFAIVNFILTNIFTNPS